MVLESQLHEYYNKSEKYLALLSSHDEEYFASYLDLIAKYAINPGDLLEIGSGMGSSTFAIASRFAHLNCFAIDISQSAIDYANENFTADNLHFEVGNAKSLNFPDNRFDIVTSYDCLEHIPDLESVLIEQMRVVNHNGYLIIKGPNHLSPLFTFLDMVTFSRRFKLNLQGSYIKRLAFELVHFAQGLAGNVNFIPREPDLTDSVQTGNDADAVTEMCVLDVYNFFKQAGWNVLNISWPRKNRGVGKVISKYAPYLGSMGIVAQKPDGAKAEINKR